MSLPCWSGWPAVARFRQSLKQLTVSACLLLILPSRGVSAVKASAVLATRQFTKSSRTYSRFSTRSLLSEGDPKTTIVMTRTRFRRWANLRGSPEGMRSCSLSSGTYRDSPDPFRIARSDLRGVARQGRGLAEALVELEQTLAMEIHCPMNHYI
jgi:hypothetical protein